RIGRTGRAGSTGSAMSLVDRSEIKLLNAIEKLIKRPIERTTVEGWSPDMVKAEPAHVRADDERPRRNAPSRRPGAGNGRSNGARAGERPAGRPRSENGARRSGNGAGHGGQATPAAARPRNSSARRSSGGPRAALLGSTSSKG